MEKPRRAPAMMLVARLGALLLALLLALPVEPAHAATFTVTVTDDAAHVTPVDGTCTSTLPGGTCTLRAAVQAVNALAAGGDAGPHTIALATAGMYTLSVSGANENDAATGDLDANGATLAITNTSGGTIVIKGGERALDVGPSSAAQVSISGLTIAESGSGAGAGIRVAAGSSLTATDVTIRDNLNNTVAPGGGGIYNSGHLVLTRVTVSNNQSYDMNAGGRGGGIYNSGTAVISDSTFSSNSAAAASFHLNLGGDGGAIYNDGGTLTLTNVTVSHNAASYFNWVYSSHSSGGGISNSGGVVTLINVTMHNNYAEDGTSISGQATLKNTIVAHGHGEPGATNCYAGSITSQGNNLSTDSTCIGAGDLPPNSDPRLGPLQLNAPGNVQTHALLAGSPAIDAGNNAGCPSTDQRGAPRPFDGNGDGTPTCDIGAYEVQKVLPVVQSFQINGGSQSTASPAVTLKLEATGSPALTEMSFSNDGSSWSAWQPFATQAPWTLSPGDATKSVYVRVQNADGDVSTTGYDLIVFDTTPPNVTAFVINGGAETSTSAAVSLNTSATDGAGSGLGEMAFSNDGGANWSAWVPFAATAQWSLTVGDGPKTVQVRVRDRAGNISAPVSKAITLAIQVGSEFGVEINGGAQWTRSLKVTLTISAPPGTTMMMLSNDSSFSGGQWQPYSAQAAWTLLTAGGSSVTAPVHVRFGDAGGTELPNSRVSATIILDTQAPTGSVTIDSAPSSAQGVVRTLRLAVNDSQSGAGMQMRLSNRDDFAGAIWKPFTSSVTWDFSGGGTVYVQFRDGALNDSQVYAQSLPNVPAPGTSQTPVSCSPRPPVQVSVQKVNGSLVASLSTTGENNGLRAVRFDSFSGAIVDVGSQTNQSAPFAVSIPAGQEPTSLQFTVRRQPGATTATVRLVVIDGCGEWSTLVGGGAGAW